MYATMPAFDTHKYVNTLKAAGVPETQAEAHYCALAEVFDSHPKKDDLRQQGDDLRSEIGTLQGDFHTLRGEFGELRNEFAELRGTVMQLRGEIAPLRWMIAPTAVALGGSFIGTMALLIKNFA